MTLQRRQKDIILTSKLDWFGFLEIYWELLFLCYSKSYFLCQVTVTEDGLIKQRRLNDALNSLSSRISLNAR